MFFFINVCCAKVEMQESFICREQCLSYNRYHVRVQEADDRRIRYLSPQRLYNLISLIKALTFWLSHSQTMIHSQQEFELCVEEPICFLDLISGFINLGTV